MKEGIRSRIISSAKLLDQCRKLLTDPKGQLWGPNLRPKAVTLFVGETSAGKTTFLHNLAYHLAKGEEFLGMKPPQPLSVLYLDYESGEHIMAEHLSVIGTAEGWDFIDLRDVVRNEDLAKVLTEVVPSGTYDVIIIDSLMEAFTVENENDNAPGARQMLAVRELARHTGAAILVVHNAGQRQMRVKKAKTEKNIARGASVRMDKADVVLNYTIHGCQTSTERLLRVAKTRGPNLNDEILIRFADDYGFEVLQQAVDNQRVVEKMGVDVLEVVRALTQEGMREMERAAILLRLGIEQEDRARAQIVDRALKVLLREQKLSKLRKGVYALPEEGVSEAPEAA